MKKTEMMMKLMSRRRKRNEKDVDGIGQDEKKTSVFSTVLRRRSISGKLRTKRKRQDKSGKRMEDEV